MFKSTPFFNHQVIIVYPSNVILNDINTEKTFARHIITDACNAY